MVKSVKKAMDILTILSNSPDSTMQLSELAARTGLNKSTCAHIVDTLCESFYVERVSRKDGYRLGPWAYMLSRYGRYQNSLVSVSAPILHWLHKRTEASVFIAVICNGKKYIVYHIDKANILPMSDGNIIQGYLESTATGRLLMANMDAETLRHTFSRREKAGESGISELTPELQKHFKTIRSTGYSFYSADDPSTSSHAFSISNGSKVVAALGILYPVEMDTPEYRSKIKKLGRVAADEIGRRLYFN